MNSKLRLSLLLGIILVLLLVVAYSFFEIPFGTKIQSFSTLEGGEKVPYKTGTLINAEKDETLIVDFRDEFKRPEYEDIGHTVQLPDVMTFELYVNDVMLCRIGDTDNPNAYARNHIFVVPVDNSLLKDEGNKVLIGTGEYQSSMFTYVPTIMEYSKATYSRSKKFHFK